ncbi:phasin family protein [Massilia sp. LjRoot122]|uniref:phasin family protein n=1 Tax=Massilia sp. LjRoot122 TaxID=3342257 RepID=UPI003ECE0983
MTSLSDQFSAVRKAQFEAQFDFFNSMTTQALESASRVAALNLAVSRDAVQRSLGTGFALLNARDPRDVFTLGGQAEEQVRHLFDYGRELLGIASGVRPYVALPQALAQARQQPIETVEVVERAAEAVVAPAPAPAAEPVAAAHVAAEAGAEAEPVVLAEPAPEPLAAVTEPAPAAEPTAIAKAAGKGTPRAAVAPHPDAAPVAAAELPKVEIARPSSKRRK